MSNESLYVKVKEVIVENFNSHKNEKNRDLTPEEITVISLISNEHADEYLATTGRNDGLLYSVVIEAATQRTVLYLYNRIARKVIDEGVVL